MHSPILLILRHSLGAAVCCALFLTGKLMIADSVKWAGALPLRSTASRRLSRIFLYSGRLFEWVAVAWGIVEAAALIFVAGGWLIDLVMFGGTE
jgi:hypothetical protein